MARPDPVTVEVIRNGFVSIANTMNNNLARAAYNPVIYEMKDCSVGIFDAGVRLLGQAPGLPIFVGGFDTAIRVTLDHIGGPGALVPGDVFAVNDSELVGSHLNDVTVLAPIFDGAEHAGFSVTKAHWRDIGAKSPGHGMDTTEIFQEGYRLVPTRVYRGGEPNHGVLDLLMRNSRLPRGVWGDLHAQIAACRTGERGLIELRRRFGTEVLRSASDEIFDHAERADRDAVAAIPDGEWVVEGALDSWGPGGEPVPVRVRVAVEGSDMTIDLRGSSPTTPGNVNCGRAQTEAAARLAFKFLVNPDLEVSDGSFRNLSVVTDEGSVFDSRAPAACQYYYPHLGLMIDLFIKALSDACPDRVVAGEPADAMNILLTGSLPGSGAPFVCGEATAIGTGAHDGGDGTNGTANYGAGDLKNLPVEVIEARYPIRINHYALRPGSGGPGRWRGGLGVDRQYEMLSDGTRLSLWWERTKTPGWGLFGGGDGAPGEVVVERSGVESTMLKVDGLELSAGDRVTLRTGGGGGFGAPAERSAQAVEDDLIDGYTQEGGER
ncbi:MAG TPA: hydantoinase B/oxoprolinase family protein [Acidimicrobiia bacterium]|nr:hydantoinase B/oxoprolinase family protein [Acidimicrobiia bacterium]